MSISNGLKTARVGILIGSSRRVRVGPSVTQFIKNTIPASRANNIDIDTVDISKFNLPIFDQSINQSIKILLTCSSLTTERLAMQVLQGA